MEQQEKKVASVLQTPSPPSASPAQNRPFFETCGFIIRAHPGNVEAIRQAIEGQGAQIIFQTSGPTPLYLLRHYQVEQILQGDVSDLVEMHARKSKERRLKE